MVKNILIVGGGTSGWCSAAALTKFCPEISITVIESSSIPTIGVGESTIQFFNYFIRLLGLKDEEWMPYCNATYKGSIKFSNFKTNDYYHAPFKNLDRDTFLNTAIEWSKARIVDKNLKNSQYAGVAWPGSYLFDEHKIPESGYDEELNFSIDENVSYNLDASKFGEWLKNNYCKPKGVKVIDDVIEVITKNEDGSIHSLNNKYKADLYIDCTGFKSLLLNELEVEFTPYKELWNDRAVVVNNIPYSDKDKELEFVVDTIAKDSGWIWNIPLWNRISNGFVHSSKYLTEEEAKGKLLEHIAEVRGKKIAKKCTPFVVPFKNGRRNVAWKKNVVGIGLSFGFIEPLGSTGLFLTQMGILGLIRTLRTKRNDYNIVDINAFNEHQIAIIDDLKDFYLIHFVLTDREDNSYWKHIKYGVDITSKSFERNLLELGSISKLDDTIDIQFLEHRCWQYIGMGYTPNPLNLYLDDKYQHNINEREEYFKQHIKNMPSIYNWLKTNIYKNYD